MTTQTCMCALPRGSSRAWRRRPSSQREESKPNMDYGRRSDNQGGPYANFKPTPRVGVSSQIHNTERRIMGDRPIPAQRPDNAMLIHAINNMTILSGLGSTGVAEVAAAAVWREYAQGGIVFLEGDPSPGLCHLHRGWLKVFKMSVDGREQVLRHLGPGETFNEVGALCQAPNPASVMALEPSGVWIIPRHVIKQVIAAHPELAVPMLENMAIRMTGLVDLVAELTLHSVEVRLARFLLDRADDEIMHRQTWATYAEMAARLGTVPDVLSRALRSLVDAELIRVERQAIHILNRAGLEVRARRE